MYVLGTAADHWTCTLRARRARSRALCSERACPAHFMCAHAHGCPTTGSAAYAVTALYKMDWSGIQTSTCGDQTSTSDSLRWRLESVHFPWGEGEVLTWKFVKDLQFGSIEDQLTNLQQRLLKQGKQIAEFYIDNCCFWRKKLQDVFGSHLIVLIFHAVQRIATKISKRHPFSFQCVQDLKLAFRDPSDRGPERIKPTPNATILHQNIDRFVAKWKNIQFNEVKVLPPSALREVNCILKHVDRGCLSNILPGRGTNRNERLHRVEFYILPE